MRSGSEERQIKTRRLRQVYKTEIPESVKPDYKTLFGESLRLKNVLSASELRDRVTCVRGVGYSSVLILFICGISKDLKQCKLYKI